MRQRLWWGKISAPGIQTAVSEPFTSRRGWGCVSLRSSVQGMSGAPSAKFNVGTGTGRSVLEVMRAVEEVTGTKVPYVMGPRRAGDPPILVANSDRLQKTLGWRPAYTDIREIVKTALAFHRQMQATRS